MSLNLYHLTVQPPTAITHSVTGRFTSPQRQEFLVCRGRILEIYKVEEETKVLTLVLSTNLFATVRALEVFHLEGLQRDYIAVTSDSGTFSVLLYDDSKKKLVQIQNHTFGKTGCRRTVPGQYLAVDPQGRAAMIAAVEKSKLAVVIGRNSQGQATFSSVLEARNSDTVVYSFVALDAGSENPLFASLELNHGPSDRDSTGNVALVAEKAVIFYELHLGMNSVSRVRSERVPNTAHKLIPIPFGETVDSFQRPSKPTVPAPLQAPLGSVCAGGVLVCCEDEVIYITPNGARFSALIPRRRVIPENKGVIIQSYAMQKTRKLFYFLLQSEYGDLYRVHFKISDQSNPSIGMRGQSFVTGISLQYYDTLPSPTTSLSIHRKGFLFAAMESGDHFLYEIINLGSPQDEQNPNLIKDVIRPPPTFKGLVSTTTKLLSSRKVLPNQITYFIPNETLVHLREISTLPNFSPFTDMQMMRYHSLTEEGTQLCALTGKGAQSSMVCIQAGIAVNQIGLSDSPGNPTGIWTVLEKVQIEDSMVERMKYIIISTLTFTLVMAVGEDGLQPVDDHGMLTDVQTLYVTSLDNGTILQIHPGGLHTIKDGKPFKAFTLKGRTIKKAVANRAQAVIALDKGEVRYFELDPTTQNLEEKANARFEYDVTELDISTEIHRARVRTEFLAVGLANSTVRIMSLEPSTRLHTLSTQVIKAPLSSLSLVQIGGGEESGQLHNDLSTFLCIGLQNGAFLRSLLDSKDGTLVDTRMKILGTRPVKQSKIIVNKRLALLALSSTPWLLHRSSISSVTELGPGSAHSFSLTHLCTPTFDYASPFMTQGCDEGCITVSPDSVRVIVLDTQLDTSINELTAKSITRPFSPSPLTTVFKVNLEFSPRRYTILPRQNGSIDDHNAINEIDRSMNLAVLETQQSVVPSGEKEANRQAALAEVEERRLQGDELGAFHAQSIAEQLALPSNRFGHPVTGPGKWASSIRLIQCDRIPRDSENDDPVLTQLPPTSDLIEFRSDESAFALAPVQFTSRKGEGPFLAVGTAKNLIYEPIRTAQGGCIHIYTVKEEKERVVKQKGDDDEDDMPDDFDIITTPKFQLVHSTATQDIPFCLKHFKGRLLAGCGQSLVVYDMGKQRLLVKCSNRKFPSFIVQINVLKDRIFVSDISESVHIVRYRRDIGQIEICADTTIPRWTLSTIVLDYDTICGTDRFGQFFVERLPIENQDMDDDPTGLGKGILNGAPYKLESMCEFFIGEAATTMCLGKLGDEGKECVIYGTSLGGLGTFQPITQREQLEQLSMLEASLRQIMTDVTFIQKTTPFGDKSDGTLHVLGKNSGTPISLVGRDHLSFRSAYVPVKGVIDGDLCETFFSLERNLRERVAQDMNMSEIQIEKLIEEMRNRLF
ncbi:putative Spliceosome-associated protein 130 A [Blattamonas nauphoetae]|uniref:Spliceosome-associated protein 130 A n=1 Tax=Blattamonas nauphoetae TaxID=2049346 RepID=A0ABQ9XJF9_9EUKA|nr:putative Spliceosome-associated protein 130 A [Blattamonas nauphoetae]